MASAESVSLDQGDHQIHIDQLSIVDEDLYSYLATFSEQEREQAVARALRIGASALDLMETTKQTEYVDRRFEDMEREFEGEIDDLSNELDNRFGEDGDVNSMLKRHLGHEGTLSAHLDDAFGEEGEFVQRLEDELGEEGEKIQEALNPNKEGTPTHQLKQEIQDLKRRFDEKSGEQKIRERTPLKGFDFEDEVEHILVDLVRQTPNSFQDTSEERGSVGSSLKGDFVVNLEDTDQRIVVEAKNGNFDGTIADEMEEAIKNRGADYGILVASSLDYLPSTKVGWFSETDKDYVVVALSENPGDQIEPRFLKFAYHWARTRTLLSAVEVSDEVDPEKVKSELDGMRQSVDNFSQIRSECTTLESSVENIRSKLDDIDENITKRLQAIEKELGTESSP